MMNFRRSISLLTLLSLGSGGALRLEMPPQLSAVPGDFLTVPLKFTPENGEPLPGQVTFSPTAPSGWDTLSGGDVSLTNGEAAVSFFLPEAAPAGAYTLPLSFTAASGQKLSGRVTVNVAAFAGVGLQLQKQDSVTEGEARSYPLTVTNLGNHPDTFMLAVEGDGRLERDRVALQAGESATVQVQYRKNGLGNQASLHVTAICASDPSKRESRDLFIGVRPVGLIVGSDRPQLFYNVQVSAESLRVEGATTFGLGVAGTLSGQLSDSVNLFAQYQRLAPADSGQPWQDLGLLLLQGENWDLRAAESAQLSNVALDGSLVRGDTRFGVGVGRSVRGAVPYFSVRGSVEERAGWRAAYEHRFVAAGEDDLRAGWQGRLAQFEPSLDLYTRRQGERWTFGVREALGYENQFLLASQRYDFNVTDGSHDFSLGASMRRAAPFTLSGALNVQAQAGTALRANAVGRAGYVFNPDLRATLSATGGTEGFGLGLDLSQTVHLLPGDLNLTAGLGYAASGDAGGLSYNAGADFAAGPLGLSASLVGDGLGLRGLGAHAVFGGTSGLQLSGGADLRRGAAGAWNSQYSLGVGYVADAWQGGLSYGLSEVNGQFAGSVGGSLSARLTPSLNLGVSGSYGPARTTVRLGASYDFQGGFLTPAPIVALAGGRKVGTLSVNAFVDANGNGKRDPGEGPAANLQLAADGVTGTTDAGGQLRLELRPKAYSVGLGPSVTATYLAATLPPVQVFEKTVTRLDLPIGEVGALQGRLTTDDGQPVVGIQVTARGAGGEQGATTDASGFYRLGGLSFGRYTLGVQLDPALLETPAPVILNLTRDQALLSQNLTARRVAAQVAVYNASDFSLDLSLPEGDLPPGASFPVSVTTSAPADGVRLTGAGLEVSLTSADKLHWQGQIGIPEDRTQGFELTAHARSGKGETTERGYVSVDPNLSPIQLLLAPGYALPGQVLDARLTYYGAGQQLELVDERGEKTPLVPGGDHAFTAQLKAQQNSGSHVLKLFVDGAEVQGVTYTVLGRP